MTLQELTDRLARHCERYPGDAGLEVVLSSDEEGNSGRALAEIDICGWFRPLRGVPALGDLIANDDADPETDLRVVILWPAA